MRWLSLLFILAICCEAKYIPEDGIYSVAEQMPEYTDGIQEFEQHVKDYISANDLETGSVFVSFVITDTGDLQDIKVVKSISDIHDELAVKAIKSAPNKWQPGSDEGKPVSVKMVYPVHFK
jgi:TonB family protein